MLPPVIYLLKTSLPKPSLLFLSLVCLTPVFAHIRLQRSTFKCNAGVCVV